MQTVSVRKAPVPGALQNQVVSDRHVSDQTGFIAVFRDVCNVLLNESVWIKTHHF